MNVLILVNSFPPEIRSSSHLFYELSESLVQKGHKVTVVTPFPSYTIEDVDEKYRGKFFLSEMMNGIHIIRLKAISLPKDIRLARALDQFLRSSLLAIGGSISGSQDVILVYSPPLPLGLSGSLLSKVKNSPFILNVQDIYPQSLIDLGILKNPLVIKLFQTTEKFIYKMTNYITVHSEGNREFLIDTGVDSDKVVVIHNWVDTELIKPSDNKLNEFHKENNLNGKFIVSFAGIMGYAQGLDVVIATAEVLSSYEDILFLMIGDGVKKSNLQKQAKELNLKNVKFLPMQPKEKYPQVLSASDICLVTLSKEVTTPVVPGKLLSIMASGRPVVASVPSSGDTPKIIKEAQCGYSVETGNPKLLADAILKLYNAPSLRKEFGQNGRKYAEKNLSRKVCTKRYESLFVKAKGE